MCRVRQHVRVSDLRGGRWVRTGPRDLRFFPVHKLCRASPARSSLSLSFAHLALSLVSLAFALSLARASALSLSLRLSVSLSLHSVRTPPREGGAGPRGPRSPESARPLPGGAALPWSPPGPPCAPCRRTAAPRRPARGVRTCSGRAFTHAVRCACCWAGQGVRAEGAEAVEGREAAQVRVRDRVRDRVRVRVRVRAAHPGAEQVGLHRGGEGARELRALRVDRLRLGLRVAGLYRVCVPPHTVHRTVHRSMHRIMCRSMHRMSWSGRNGASHVVVWVQPPPCRASSRAAAPRRSRRPWARAARRAAAAAACSWRGRPRAPSCAARGAGRAAS